MKIVGLTGGIGSGKTTVAKMFEALNVPIYIADIEAKKLTNSSKEIRRDLIKLLGDEAYNTTGLNRKFVADKIFNDPKLLNAVNNIIHPQVAIHFKQWAQKQDSPYVIKEAAILFENGGYKDCDAVILITAPKEIRIQRVLARDKSSKTEIEQRMKNQWSDDKKRKLATFVIENIEIANTQNEVAKIHKTLLKTASAQN